MEPSLSLSDQIRTKQSLLESLDDHSPQRLSVLLDLGDLQYANFKYSKDINDLELAIAHCREALSLSPQESLERFTSLHKLSVYCKLSFDHDAYRTDNLICAMESSVAAENLAIQIDHPYLTWFHFCVTRSLDPDVDPDTPLPGSHKTSSYINASAESRFQDAVRLAEAARAQPLPYAVQMYRSAFLIAERCLTLRFTPMAQHEFLLLKEMRALPARAASCAVQEGDLEAAVELLEQGRSQIWARIRDNTYPLGVLVDVSEDLAHRFGTCCVELELLSSNDNGSQEYKKEALAKWNNLLHEIRSIEGFDSFLQPKKFAALRTAAAAGPVVIVYVDSSRSDALIIPSKTALAPSLVALSSDLYDLVPGYVSTIGQIDGQTRRIRVSKPQSGPPLSSVIKSVWKYICEPVVSQLRVLGIQEQSRIWWCPTGLLTSLPIHAAGPYENGRDNLLDIYVSSYTSSLLSLIRVYANKKEDSNRARRHVRLLAASQSNVLPKVKDELDCIKRRFSTSAQILDAAAATSEVVLKQLQNECNIVHFSCHGYLDAVRPFDSYLSLYQSALALKTLAYNVNVGSMQLAFLAACDSAAGEIAGSSGDLPPDEVISLAAAFQISGFQSVVGTLWAMKDQDGPGLSDAFYGHLLPDGVDAADYEALKPARALHFAVKKMRDDGIPLERWSTFVHIGV
ncbi:hypothetical protein GYMLUDRAFT_36234 [Collybiopsis luxurians FD-317 M1]|nr:hypothetical protein GYMLUDRAFT_36234 [Collybiopsis luxurians FD-317 M1]